MALVAYDTSGLKTSSAAIMTQRGYLCGAIILTDGDNDGTVTLYDNASAGSGTVLAKLNLPGADLSGAVMFPLPVACANGVYCTIAGTGCNAIVYTAKSFK